MRIEKRKGGDKERSKIEGRPQQEDERWEEASRRKETKGRKKEKERERKRANSWACKCWLERGGQKPVAAFQPIARVGPIIVSGLLIIHVFGHGRWAGGGKQGAVSTIIAPRPRSFLILARFCVSFFYSSPDNPTEMPTHDRRGIIEKQWAASSVVPFPTRAPFQRRLRKCV